MTAIEIVDIELNNLNPKYLELSISLSPNGLSFYIYNIGENKLVALSHFPEISNEQNQIDWINNSEVFNKDYAKIKCVICTPKNFIIPAAVYNPKLADTSFLLHFDNANDEKILHYRLSKTDNYSVFGVSNKIVEAINNKHKSVLFLNQSAPFIETNITRLRLNKEKAESTVYVNIYSNFFDVLCVAEDKMLLYNSFSYKFPNDMLYYILSIFEQLKLNQEKTHVILSGLIEKDSLFVVNLKKFISIVYFESRNITFKYYYKFQDIAPHYFCAFINSIECE